MKELIGFMQKIEDKLNHCAAVLACVTFACMSVIVVVQVISRSFLGHSFQWAEEMARYFFIWSTMLAATCATHAHVHIGVDVLVTYLKGNVQRTVRIVAQLFLIFAVLVLVRYGGEQTVAAWKSGQTATSFPVSAGLLYLSVPLNGVLMLFICVTQLLELICLGTSRDVEIASGFWS
jgi:TRAP-type C4-dicarboxylate transport system, small permease component